MKVLLTGATGFLGRSLIDLLCQDDRVEQIFAPSRKCLSHPDPKVSLIRCDLSKPSALAQLDGIAPDVVVHLAAKYDFDRKYDDNYVDNVVCTDNLLRWMVSFSKNGGVAPRLVFASSYAVGIAVRNAQYSELPLRDLPPRDQPFARTKALAEQLVLAAPLDSQIFRLGVLVGDSRTGATTRIRGGGVYPALRFLEKFQHSSLGKYVPFIPIFARRNVILPLVPVDCASRVLHRAVFRSVESPGHRIFGLYNKSSISLERLTERIFENFGLSASPLFVAEVPRFVLERQHRLSGIPRESFELSIKGPALDNHDFESVFSDLLIPDFNVFEKRFFKGYFEYIGESAHAAAEKTDSGH